MLTVDLPIVINPRKRTEILLLILSPVLIYGPLQMIEKSELLGYPMMALSVLVIISCAIQMHPDSCFTTIGHEGIDSRFLFLNKRIHWQEIEGFDVHTSHSRFPLWTTIRVTLSLAQDSPNRGFIMSTFVHPMLGFDAIFPETKEYDACALANLLNLILDQKRQQPGPGPIAPVEPIDPT